VAADRPCSRPGVLVGVGLAGTLDEVILHQLLGWHHFYDRSTPAVGLVSDGLFHLFSTAVLVVGVIQLVERRTTPDPPGLALALAGTLLLRRTRQPTPDPITLAPRPRASVHSAFAARPVPHAHQPEWRSGSASDS
jgi:Predicted membrane protein (DUF2243)